MHALALIGALTLAQAAAPPTSAPPVTPAPTVAPAPAAQPAAPIDQPPPSAWDRAQAERGETPQGDSMGGQLVRTVLALAGVVALIYLLFKIGLGRLLQGGAIRTGRTIKVIERVPVDARHALVIVELPGGERLLLGSSERGMNVLTTLKGEVAQPGSGSFQQVLDKTRGDSPESS